MNTNYVELTGELMDLLAKTPDALEKYAEVFKSRIEMASRDLVLCNDSNLTQALRGQIAICFEQADAATKALNGKKGNANPDGPEETPEW